MMKILTFLCFFYSLSAIAGQWPVITSIETEDRGNNSYRFYITQKLIEIGASVDVVMPEKYIELTHRHNPMQEDVVGDALATLPTSSTDTVSKTAISLYNSDGASVTYVNHTGSDPEGKECVAYIVSPNNDQKSHQTPWGNVWAPGGCMIIPPANEWCKITTPELVLDHGTISLQQAEGSTAAATLGLQCTVATAVTFNLITQDNYIYLDEGKSEITVDDKPLNSKVDLQEGDSQLPIKDLLTGVTSEGFHTGSSVLVMMPY